MPWRGCWSASHLKFVQGCWACGGRGFPDCSSPRTVYCLLCGPPLWIHSPVQGGGGASSGLISSLPIRWGISKWGLGRLSLKYQRKIQTSYPQLSKSPPIPQKLTAILPKWQHALIFITFFHLIDIFFHLYYVLRL